MKVGTIRHLYIHGLNDYEIVERTGASLIQVQHTISFICDKIPGSESKHNTTRKKLGRYVRAHFINDDPHCEKVCRFVEAL